ncbi:MAG: AAA family ATPase [Bacteroidetes bacterium SW_11_45_7]|nr:MAG: AAA family ATPase [Bacteroidetes bacterium SW_11_45_7]
MRHLIRKSIKKVQGVALNFKRYLHATIDWTDRLIIIKGARGVGKTTLLLQHIKETHGVAEEALYVSLDDIWFADNRLTDLAEQFANTGGRYLFIDEVHKYPEWSQEIKNIYDDHHDLQIVLTSSSALQIASGKGDLSRRAVIYELNELSLREYIALEENIDLKPLRLDELFSHHLSISAEIAQATKPLKAMKNYLSKGNYPYFRENPGNYHHRLQSTVNTILETDLPAILNMDYSSVIKLKKLLYVIATSGPFKPNISALSEKTGIARDTLLRYLHHLSEAHLIQLLHSSKQGMSYLAKPDKIYLYNTNLFEALTGNQANTGTMRETFFLNQVSNIASVRMHDKGDYLVNDHYVFEIGGKNKTSKQLKGLANAYVAADDIETGYRNQVPLWLFGMLY